MSTPTTVHDYHLLSPAYDMLAKAWSLGAIPQSNTIAINKIAEASNILVLGPGTCQGFGKFEFAPCHLTLIDSSAAMLKIGFSELAKIPQQRLHVVTDDFRSFTPTTKYQKIWLPYFLNVFSTQEVIEILGALKSWLQDGGEIVISDFMEPDPRFLHRFLQELWHGIPMSFFHLVTGNSWHGVHDLPKLITLSGYRITESHPCDFGPTDHRWIGMYVCKPSIPS